MENLEIIYRDYYKMLVHFLHKTVSEQDAEDIAIEAILKCYDRPHTKMRSLLFITANAMMIDLIRAKKRHTLSHKEIAYLNGEVDVQANEVEAVVLDTFYKATKKLPANQKTIFELYMQGLSTNEIAARICSTARTVLNHKTIAVNKIKQQLAACGL